MPLPVSPLPHHHHHHLFCHNPYGHRVMGAAHTFRPILPHIQEVFGPCPQIWFLLGECSPFSFKLVARNVLNKDIWDVDVTQLATEPFLFSLWYSMNMNTLTPISRWAVCMNFFASARSNFVALFAVLRVICGWSVVDYRLLLNLLRYRFLVPQLCQFLTVIQLIWQQLLN